MFLKRSIALVAGLFLFIIGFIIYFHLVDGRIEGRFSADRTRFGVEGTQLASSATTAATPAPATSTSVPPITLDAPAPVHSAPAAGPASLPDTSLPSPTLTPTLSLPDPTAPGGTDSNPAPASPPSTMLRPLLRDLVALSMGQTAPPLTTEPPATLTNTPGESSVSPEVSSPSTNNFPAAAGKSGGSQASVIILGYHQFVGPGQSSKNPYCMKQEVFAEEMKYLKDNNFNVVPLSEVMRFIHHEISLPSNTVAITIDDGYKSPILWAAPILKQYGFPWTFFVYPDFITKTEGKGAASWPDLVALQAEGVDVECHSKSHPKLTKHGNKTPEQYDEWLTAETAGAKATIEQHLNKTVKYFAYPYGDYNKAVEEKVVGAGFEGIFTVADNPVHADTNPYRIGRYIITQPVERLFANYLRQGALSLGDVDPAPGATISQPRPVISAVLNFAGTLDPKSIEVEVRDYGRVPFDFDPKTSTIRLYLQRDLVQPVVLVSIHARDAKSGQMMVANWHFNYESAGAPANTATPLTPATSPAPVTPIPAAAPVPKA